MKPSALQVERVATPCGDALIVTDAADVLLALEWQDHERQMLRSLRRYRADSDTQLITRRSPSRARLALEAYWSGELYSIDNVPVQAAGTAFQQAVWQALRLIAAGRTTSYGALAAQLGRPRAMRAVGLANGANPICVVVPCHRVIGADGSLTGYGGGLARKRWLLEHEAKHLAGASTRLARTDSG